MFNKLSEHEILEKLDSRENEITDLAKLPLLNNSYLSFLAKYEGDIFECHFFKYTARRSNFGHYSADHADNLTKRRLMYPVFEFLLR